MKFIAVHVRRGDFKNACKDGRKNPSCDIPLSTFADHVESVREQLLQIKKRRVDKVVLFSGPSLSLSSFALVFSYTHYATDEKDPNFWDEVKSRGWHRIDHDAEGTEKKYSGWHPTLIDVAIQSMASGFVGTTGSTFSLVSLKRVESWNDGIGVMARGF